jgi:hypothetical protein
MKLKKILPDQGRSRMEGEDNSKVPTSSKKEDDRKVPWEEPRSLVDVNV